MWRVGDVIVLCADMRSVPLKPHLTCFNLQKKKITMYGVLQCAFYVYTGN